jgi:L-fuconolactonase
MKTNFNRRQFLAVTAQTLSIGALAGCATNQSSVHDANTVIDTHTHFYDPSRPQGVPWPGRDNKLLYRTVLPKDYRAQSVPRPVTGTVVVEASPWIEDNQWILDLAANDPFIVGFVGSLPVATDQFAPNLKRFSPNKLFRGIRIGVSNDSLDKKSPLLRDLKLLADYNLSLDLLGGLDILAFANRVSEQIPSLRIVIDHLAGVRIDGKAPPREWIAAMSAAAKQPNIFCKVSGLVEGTNCTDVAAPRDPRYYAPVLDIMTNAFTPSRLIYASNWPVSARFAPLSTVQSIIEDYFSAHAASALSQVMWRSGQTAYRWRPRDQDSASPIALRK